MLKNEINFLKRTNVLKIIDLPALNYYNLHNFLI